MTITPTRTQKAMMVILNDGLPHLPEELFDCLEDDLSLAKVRAVQKHLVYIRQHLEDRGLGILPQYLNGKLHYRLIRFVNRGDE